MWIKLTACDGRTFSFNSDHLVALHDHGDRTLVTHTRGEAIVRESQPAIFEAMGLQTIDRPEPKRERRLSVH